MYSKCSVDDLISELPNILEFLYDPDFLGHDDVFEGITRVSNGFIIRKGYCTPPDFLRDYKGFLLSCRNNLYINKRLLFDSLELVNYYLNN